MEKSIVKKEENNLVADNQSGFEALLGRAIDGKVDVAIIERMLAVYKDIKASKAKESYDRSMAEFQRVCPVINKNRAVKDKNGDVRYHFAPLESIVKQVGPLIADNGFSYAIKILNDEKGMTAVCRITHTQGHSEESPFFVPIGSEAYMTDVQKYGARSTFAKRYAFCNAFGILTGDEDSDAVEVGKEKTVKSEKPKKETYFTQAETMIKNAKSVEFLISLQEKIKESGKFNPEEKTKLHKQINEKAKTIK